ncbi:MarR family transcriptional regulator [Mesorhizobium sp. M1C.F.Ca.ET.193.01.1.1]|uniref:ArsR/SmtB family transcription factor n=1 Tax=unclassified Mesorhizobium TaxID=325217 RepID=UPI000FD1FA34|nr:MULTISPECIES: helix-turn-helix domain-containing protein [unclassified Mesorhizobium]TGT04072.1 MarR family transcriptional regulator [bacterium M00.F.Ca.ET.177.01.1.1]TGQ56666.1 MarR family transcriptional regulator [Mesorhizobium sp. M1C.F.Ca.ET.210.01.1.1]TGQ75433.1 MarR family transcriptional regulator [Mesorhizobium sp. M1C.F.Ca.ET.212.01.1.1]TGR13842.1 MarR family transcriptional regulator [Mesorhizobium sp. M1C.F.Ca.ET.204.01.1.1]TGR34097.1 MarR family transcriptional regulator [Meso
MKPNFLTIDPEDDIEVLKGLASPIRVRILKLLRSEGPLNVNDITRRLELPQSTVAINVQTLEEAGLIVTEAVKARKGHQKICSARFDEIIVRFEAEEELRRDANVIEVAMPLGLFTSVEVSPPCGLCSTDGVIGLLDVPDSFLDPARVQAALIWFGMGSVEYKFPNNAKLLNAQIESIEFSMELSSEVPGTNMDWPSDLSLWVNDVAVGTWTSPGDYGDKRGVYTPSWWKLAGSQYGKLKSWRIGQSGSFIDGVRISDVTVNDLGITEHRSIRMRIGIDAKAKHPGGVNIFGRGFGNYDQDIVMRLELGR